MVANQAAAGRHRGDLQEVRLQGVSHAGATGSQGIATRSPVRLAGVGLWVERNGGAMVLRRPYIASVTIPK